MHASRLVTLLLLAGSARASAQDFQCVLAAAPPGAGIGTVSRALDGDDVTLTVAALYTPEAADSAIAHGQPIGEWITDAFDAWQVVLDSATAPGPRVVAVPLGMLEVDMVETGACFADLDAFRAHPRSAAIRDSLRANLVVLFARRCSASYQCTPTSDCEASAYAIAQYTTAGAPGPLGGHALAHEAGHLLGMRHDAGADPTPGYNHGYRDEPGGFFTVMSTEGPLPPTDIVSAYSDPLRTFEGRPLGTLDVSDNARVLRENAPVASTWNQDVPAEPGPDAPAPALRAVPNPAVGGWLVLVGATDRGGADLALIDPTGRTVWTDAVEGAGPRHVEVPAAGLAPGVYMLRATWNDGAPGSSPGQARARILGLTLTR